MIGDIITTRGPRDWFSADNFEDLWRGFGVGISEVKL
jgi:hypothetical protein